MVKNTKKKIHQKQKQSQSVIVNIHSQSKARQKAKPRRVKSAPVSSQPTYVFRTNDSAVPHFQMPTQAVPSAVQLPIRANVVPAVHMETQTEVEPFLEAMEENMSPHRILPIEERIWIKIANGLYKLKPDVQTPYGKFFNTETGRFNQIPKVKSPFK